MYTDNQYEPRLNLNNTSKFKVFKFDNPSNFDTGKFTCEKHYLEIAKVKNAETVAQLKEATAGCQSMWLGGTYDQESQGWLWEDKHPFT